MPFQQQQQRTRLKPWQHQSQSKLKEYLPIYIFFFCCCYLLLPVQSRTINPAFLSQETTTEPWDHLLEAKYQEEASLFFDEKIAASSPPATPQPASIKLSMTRSLSSLNLEAYSIVLSKDGKTAFVSLADRGDIEIVDVSNLNKISLIDLIRLPDTEYPFLLNSLELSSDGHTLFVSSMQYLHLIDVSNTRAPRVLCHLKDEYLTDYFKAFFFPERHPFEFRISMAFSKDQKTLFIGGLGLQVVDISNKSQPVFTDINTKKVTIDDLLFSEVRVSPNGETLYLANGTLNIYNISDVRDWKLLGLYSVANSRVSSVLPSKQDENAVYVAGYHPYSKFYRDNYKTFYVKLNVTDPSNPTELTIYNFIYFSKGNIYILGQSFDETITYFFAYTRESGTEFGIFNLYKDRFKEEDRSQRGSITSIATFPGDETKILIAQNFDTLEVLEFYTNYPNNRIYSSANLSIASFPFESGFRAQSMILSSDSKTLIVQGRMNESSAQLQVFNVSNLSKPRLMSSFSPKFNDTRIKFLEDAKKIFLVSEKGDNISFLSLSEDLKTLELTQSFSKKGLGKLEKFHFSADGKIGYFICSHFYGLEDPDPEDAYVLRIVSFSGPSSSDFEILSETNCTYPSRYESLFSRDSRYLFIVGSRIIVYDLSNPQKPREISSTLIDFHYQNTYPTCAYLSPDEQSIFTRTFDGFKYTLRIYNVQNFSAIHVLSDMELPKKFDSGRWNTEFVFSPDYKMVYMGWSNEFILAINTSNQTSPFVEGAFIVPGFKEHFFLKMSRDGKIIFYLKDSTLQIARLQPPYTLYIDTESVRLGDKYSKPTALLQSRSDGEYELSDNEYKFIETSLFDVQINKKKNVPLDCREISLPYWMNFDKKSQILTLEPKKQEHLEHIL